MNTETAGGFGSILPVSGSDVKQLRSNMSTICVFNACFFSGFMVGNIR